MPSDILYRNNVTVVGEGTQPLVLAHGFGCDQRMWRFLVPLLRDHYRLVLFDYVGSGRSDYSAFSLKRYETLDGYAQDVLELCQAMDLHDAAFVGHSVSGTIGLLASLKEPERFSRLIMVNPSPCFLNRPPSYFGGFEEEDFNDLLDLMEKNHIGWAKYLAPLVLGSQAPDQMLDELVDSFCSADPVIGKTFARATFFSDYRHLLSRACHPALLMQSTVDNLASLAVGEYMHQHMPDSQLYTIEGEGHCLHMTHPEAVSISIRSFLSAGNTSHA